MLDQIIENFRRASESSLQMQQEAFKQLAQQWSGGPHSSGSSGPSADWTGNIHKRSIDLTVESLNRNCESLEAMYRSGIGLVEQALRVSEAKSPEDYRRMVDELWRKLFTTFKEQSEVQLREFQRWAETMFEMAPRPASNQS
jgi:hypothetical protein